MLKIIQGIPLKIPLTRHRYTMTKRNLKIYARVHLRRKFPVLHPLKFQISRFDKSDSPDHAEDNSGDTPQDTFDETSLHND